MSRKISEISENELKKLIELSFESIDQFELPRLELIKENMNFRTLLSHESDRGIALMAAAFLEDQLEQLLTENLVGDSSVVKGVFSFNGSLGTFSSKIDMSYLLGLIPNNARADLDIIRRIRNEFAHDSSLIDFKTDKIKSRCENLVFDGVFGEIEPSAKFRRAVMGILSVITSQRIKATNLEPMKDHDIKSARELMKEVFKTAFDIEIDD